MVKEVKEYSITMIEIENGKEKSRRKFNIHPLLFLEVCEMMDDRAGDSEYWVREVT